jgi:hypothetical protein
MMATRSVGVERLRVFGALAACVPDARLTEQSSSALKPMTTARRLHETKKGPFDI